MIDIRSETIVTLGQARKKLPPRRGGKQPDLSTLYRWCSPGLRGVKLETIQIGGQRCTSVEALQRFFDRLSTRPDASNSPKASEAKRQDDIEAELARAGV